MKSTLTLLLLIPLYVVSFAQKPNKTYTLQQLQTKFKHKNYTTKVLLDFQKTMADLRVKPELYEDIPGEVISWFTLNGRYSWHRSYLIKKDSIVEVNTIPKDETFLKKLNSYVPEKSKFAYGSDLWSFGYIKQKLKKNYYLITATAKSFNSHPDIPSDDILRYDLEYKTKDFKTFKLVRLKDTDAKEWIVVD